MEEAETRMLQAQEVYVLMKKDYRISRNIRASWFFEHLNKSLLFTPQENLTDSSDELQVASVVPDDLSQCIPGKKYNVTLLSSSMVTFVARRYRFVIILDLSPSVCSVDTGSCSVLYEKVHKTLSNFLRGLVLPFCLPGSSAILTPEVHITVIAYTPVKSFTFNQVLAQGLIVNGDNIDKILSSMEVKLEQFEKTLAKDFSKIVEGSITQFTSSYFDVRADRCDNPGSPLPKESDIINNTEAGIVNMIRSGMLALQLLPENSSAGLVVITDGCLGVPDANLFEFLLTQLRTSTIACTFLRIGESRSAFGHFGHIPHTELMQFIATATFGSYFDNCPNVTPSESTSLNIYHKAMFLWSFQRGIEGFRYDLGDQHLMAQQSSSPAQLVQRLLSHPIHGKLASVMPSIRKRHSENLLPTSLFSVLSVRLREGYTIRDIAVTKGESQLEVRLVLPWREYARFEYLVRASWPLDQHRNTTHTEITIEGSYDFLHDMTCTKINTRMMSPFRSANVRKFWLALQGLSETDQLLVHLQAFSTNPVNYTLPETIKKGVPLFYLSLPNSTVPSLSTQLNSKDPVLNQFASFWRPVVNLDIKVWQKWMHTHRIGLVLEHDIPLHKNIHIPNSSGRFSMVMCRQSMTSLNLFLMDWTTFVLLDNQSYIKLMFDNPEDKTKPPSSFVLIRITSKTPCLVLRLAFLGGTPGYQRYALVKELKQKMSKLRFPQRGPKADKKRAAIVKRSEEGVPWKAPLLREWAEIYCCVLLLKPVESILIRYERMPRDMTKLEDQEKEVSHFVMPQVQAKNKSAANLFNSLSRYLLHRRWIWTVQQPRVSSISMQGIGRILSTLAKIRIQQGFHFSLTNSGIINMMLEADVKDPESNRDYTVKSKQRPSCVVQYILFPPHAKTTTDGMSDDEGDMEMESPEDEGELQIITECWVEPQHGILTNNTPERKEFDGLTYDQIADTLFPVDLACISTLITFEHLMYLCQNSVIPADLAGIVNTEQQTGTNITSLSQTIQHVAFPFNLLSLLPKSQQAELIYPTFIYDPDEKNPENQKSAKESNYLLFSLIFEELHASNHREVTLSQEQSHVFHQHIKSRSRSTESNPYPFDLDNILSEEKQNVPEDQAKQSKQAAHLTAVKSVQSQSLSASHGSLPNIHSSSKTQGLAKQEEKGSNSKQYPQWKCFIKAINTSALMLTFIPATFDDLILLNKTHEDDNDAENLSNVENEKSGKDVPGSVQFQTPQSVSGKANEVKSSYSTDSQSAESKTHTPESQPLHSTRNTDEASSSHETAVPDRNEETSHDQGNGCDEKTLRPSLYLPVYVYDCVTHNVLDSLINPWGFQPHSDIFQDMTFDFMHETPEETGPLASPKLKRVAFSAESIKDEEDSSYRYSWRSQERRSTEGSNEGGENLWQHCASLSEMHYHCYVKGVFQSLQKGHIIECQDVDAAINNICEESLPLETNITTFLHASCGHFQQLVNEVKNDEEQLADQNVIENGLEEVKRPSVRFMDILDDIEIDTPSLNKHIPSVLEIPKVTTTFDLESLHLDIPCEPIKNLHGLIKNKVLDCVQKWFRPVSSSPDFYFYCPETPMNEELSDDRETTASDAGTGMANTATDLPEADVTMVTDSLPLPIPPSHQSTISMCDSEESMEDDADLDIDFTLDDKSDQSPLFINFTCTVKSRLQQYSISLKNIAACLSELSTVIENLSEVDLGDLKITFDLNCLTLPSDLETSSPRRQSYIRMLSNSSLGGYSNSSSDAGDRLSSIDVKHLRDPIVHLPQMQQDAVTKCMEEIELLLRDEIVSNLRRIPPIKSDALSYVTKHIHTSHEIGKANVSVESVPLQFVFGVEQSKEKFMEEFQKMNLQSYQLIKEEKWYYLAMKRMIGYNFINAVDLSSALDQLSQGSEKSFFTQAPKDKQWSPGYKSDVLEDADGKPIKSLSSLGLNQKEKGFDIAAECIGRSSPLTVKCDSQADIAHEQQRHSCESTFSVEKKNSAEAMGLESLSLINRRRSKDLVLKMLKGSTDSLNGVERRRSCDTGEESSPVDAAVTLRRTIQEGATNLRSDGGTNESALKIDSGNTPKESVPEDAKENSSIGFTSISQKRSSIESEEIKLKGSVSSPSFPKPGESLFSAKAGSPTVSFSSSSKTGSPVTCLPSASNSSPGMVVSNSGSQVTSAVQSPVVSEISIQLTKTDGRCEPFRSSPERNLDNQSVAYESFECEDIENEGEGVLKRCSSFAGFHSREPCDHIKPDSAAISQAHSPIKGIQQGSFIGPLGRYRHCSAPLSGHGTPKSRTTTMPPTPSCISSRGSFLADGTSYDGDMSEIDDNATTFSENCIVRRRMPNFWLIMQIGSTVVDILYHHRETGHESNEEMIEQRQLLAQVKANVEETCRKVNQLLLLYNLYETRMCHALLVDAADEDVSWKLDKGPKLKSQQRLNASSSENEEDDDDMFERKYLAAAMDLNPGHFDCPCVWRTSFYIHPGLKRGSGRGSTMSIGVKALRSVLNTFSVNNRNNMFVIKETTGNVYYLRLKELQAGISRTSMAPEDSNDSLSMSSGLKRDGTEVLTTPDKDPDTISISSSTSTLSLSQSQRNSHDYVELNVHGIQEAGKEIKEHLVQLLQSKLDEATLDKIFEMLRRNPQCQLDREDVQFIQRPSSDPTTSLHCTVSNKASPHLAAVMYYLRQNLLQYLHPPKYKSSNTDNHFMDTFDGKQAAIPTDQAFIYIAPHTARKTGVACISICLVDGQGNQVKLLQCPKPSSLAYMDIETKEDLEAFVVTQVYEMKHQGKKPGPTALIQFHIWERGDVEIPVLQEKLILSLKHTLCDVVMEYYVLTAPLCEIPKNLKELLPPLPTLSSAPSSPYCSMQGEEFRERKFSMVSMSKTSESPPCKVNRRSSFQSQSKLQSLKDALLQKVMSPSHDTNKSFDLTPHGSGYNSNVGSPCIERASPRNTEAERIVVPYETGDKGMLHSVYSKLMEDWLLYCSVLEAPAVNRLEFTLKSRFSIDYVLQEFQNIVSRTSSGMTTKVYKMLPSEEEECEPTQGILYNPNRIPFETGRSRIETSMDTCHSMVTPGEDRVFTVVGRHLTQWYGFMQHRADDDDGHIEMIASQGRGKHSSQRFEAYIPAVSEGKSFGMFCETSSFIPRQRFIFLSLKNKQLHLYTYNWTNEMFSSLSKHMNKLVQWNNARAHLLCSVVIQKSGLYNHYLFGEISVNLEKVTQQSESLDQLIHHPAPPPPLGKEKEKLTRTCSTSSVRENYLPFDAIFKDLYPKKPIHLSYLACMGDPVQQYGKQAQDIRKDHRRDFDMMNNIQKLYIMWVQKTAPNYPISEVIMKTLKCASRLFHYCATPLLFSTKWRQNVIEKYKVTRPNTATSTPTAPSVATPDTKSRSRHGSGTSTGSARTKRTDSNELKKRPSLTGIKDLQTMEEVCQQEDEWHLQLRSSYICQYIKYLQTIGFNYIQMDKSHGKPRRRPAQPTEETSSQIFHEGNEIKATDTHNLQKTVSGGVLLIELSFRQEYFCVKLYTCDHNKLRITVNQQLKLLFVDECEKCKNLIHVHSFAHDFHLRCIQSYISGKQDIFKPGYYLSGLLADFVKVYPYAPSFSRNFLQRDVVTIPEPSCSSGDLYDYMLKHHKLHSMSVLKMLLPQHTDTDQDSSHTKSHEYALISHEAREVARDVLSTSSPKSMDSYNIGLVIVQEPQGAEGDRGALKLQFYNILTSSQQIFPKYTLEKDLSALKTMVMKYSVADEKTVSHELKDQIKVKQSPGPSYNKTINYLGFSNVHQPPMYQLLQKEALVVRTKIENMAVVSMDKCRRDCLWTKMLMNSADEHVGKKRSDTEDSHKDPLSRLTYEEFCEMLGRVHKVPLHEMDRQLVPFLHMNHNWYTGLAQVINNKYPDNVKRCFINPENMGEQHHVILNPKFLELFMLLSIDNLAGKTGLFAVFRKPAKEHESICPGGQNLPEQSVQSHMEDFINTCCFHLWTSML